MDFEITVACQFCGFEFQVERYRINQGRGKFCSKQCYYESKKNKVACTCEICGKDFEAYPARIKRGQGRFCSNACYCLGNKDENSSYFGGCLTKEGYVRISIAGKLKYEHQYIMEEHLERELEDDEVVHHINGIGHDNDISNLQVMARGEHAKLHHTVTI